MFPVAALLILTVPVLSELSNEVLDPYPHNHRINNAFRMISEISKDQTYILTRSSFVDAIILVRVGHCSIHSTSVTQSTTEKASTQLASRELVHTPKSHGQQQCLCLKCRTCFLDLIQDYVFKSRTVYVRCFNIWNKIASLFVGNWATLHSCSWRSRGCTSQALYLAPRDRSSSTSWLGLLLAVRRVLLIRYLCT